VLRSAVLFVTEKTGRLSWDEERREQLEAASEPIGWEDAAPTTKAGSLQTLSKLAKISVVPGPVRITGPLLDVLEELIAAHAADDGDLHGWAIMRATRRSGPTVYGVLDRLEGMGWIEGRWEIQDHDQAGPRKRFYSLTPSGLAGAQEILRERRPGTLRPARPRHRGARPVPRQAGAQW
jgi:DNA-binding PadR family transcriptional regulator